MAPLMGSLTSGCVTVLQRGIGGVDWAAMAEFCSGLAE